MEREELRRGVLRPARPAGREMGTGGVGKALGGKDDIVLELKGIQHWLFMRLVVNKYFERQQHVHLYPLDQDSK